MEGNNSQYILIINSTQVIVITQTFVIIPPVISIEVNPLRFYPKDVRQLFGHRQIFLDSTIRDGGDYTTRRNAA